VDSLSCFLFTLVLFSSCFCFSLLALLYFAFPSCFNLPLFFPCSSFCSLYSTGKCPTTGAQLGLATSKLSQRLQLSPIPLCQKAAAIALFDDTETSSAKHCKHHQKVKSRRSCSRRASSEPPSLCESVCERSSEREVALATTKKCFLKIPGPTARRC
jgi:hypothetical protein